MAKRKFAGGNPFVSRKKYKGTMFKIGSLGRSAYKPTLTKNERMTAFRRSRRMTRKRYSKVSPTAANKLKRSFGKNKASTILKAIRNVHANDNVSIYRKGLVGDFSPMVYYNAGANTPITIGKKHWFSHFKKATNNSTFTVPACEFSAFTPQKLIDAVSVLYGGKAIAAAQDVTTDNMPNSTIANFVYASQSFEMTNQTQQPFHIRIYEMHNIGGKHNTSPVYDLYQSISSHLWISAPTGALSAGGNEMYLDDMLELTDLKPKSWKIAKTTKLDYFKPGQIHKWTAVMKDKKINFENMCSVANAITQYGPGSIVYVIEAVNVHHVCYNATAAETTYQRQTVTDDAAQTFGFRTKQVYRVAEPENVADGNEGIKTALFTDASLNGVTPTTYVRRWRDPLVNVALSGLAV